MINYSNKLYVTPTIEPKVNRIKHNLRVGKGMVGIYVISLAASEKDVFDITSITIFKQKYYRDQDITVIGFAEDYDSCVSIVCDIINEHYVRFGSYFNLRNDFINSMMG